MGADLPKGSSSNINLKNFHMVKLGPKSISKFLQDFIKSEKGVHIPHSKFISLLKIGKREVDILFEYFDLDKNGEIDKYELVCALTMIVCPGKKMREELIFKLYDFNSNNFLERDEIKNLLITKTLYEKKLYYNQIQKKWQI